MPNDIALTPEYLEHLLALGKAVPAGPWGTCLNASELFGRYFPDWGTIYANVERRGGVLEGCIIATTNRNFISDEECAAAWEKYKIGEKVDPGLSGKIAAYIAAYHPGVTTALIMEILRLRNDLAATECREGEGDAYVEQLCLERDDLEAQVARLEGEVERLNKEAYWLALHLSNAMMVPAVLDSLQMASAPEGRIPTPKMIREQVRRDLAERDAARKAVEKKA